LNSGRQLVDEALGLRKSVEKPKPFVDGLVEVARVRLELKRKPSSTQIIAALTKVPPKAKAVTAEWQTVAKTVGKLSAQHGLVIDKDD
jgi:hypothetical protein